MKIALFVTVVLAVTGLCFAIKAKSQAAAASKQETKKVEDPKHVYLGMRQLMLDSPRSKFGLPPASKPTEPWGVLMDWGIDKGTATIVATSDGSASVYLSSGGGYIGGKGQEPIRLAAEKAVEIARTVQMPPQPTKDFPMPETGGVFFYFLTDAGVFTFRTSVQEVNAPTHPLRTLGNAMQGIISQYRLWDQGGRKGGGGTLIRPD